MLKIIMAFLKSVVILCLLCGVSTAAVVSVSGNITIITPPSSVEQGMLESSATIWAFNERQAYTLASDLNVDELAASAVAGVISAGTDVNSYFLHADLIGDSNDIGDILNLGGTITFDTKIIGLIWSGVAGEGRPTTPMFLDASDYLGLSTTAYPTGGSGRGYEVEDVYTVTRDFVDISADGYSLTVSSAAFPLRPDQLRVITSVVPVPATVWLFGSGLIGLIGVARRKKS